MLFFLEVELRVYDFHLHTISVTEVPVLRQKYQDLAIYLDHFFFGFVFRARQSSLPSSVTTFMGSSFLSSSQSSA